jgi:hypothetical protein
MDATFAKLALSLPFAQISAKALKVYLVMRAEVVLSSTATTRLHRKDKKFVSGLSISELSEVAGISEIEMRPIFRELCQKGWIRSLSQGTDRLYLLGGFADGKTVWLVDECSMAKKVSQADADASKAVDQNTGSRGRESERGETSSQSSVHSTVQSMVQTINDTQTSKKEAALRQDGRKRTSQGRASETRQQRILAEAGLIDVPKLRLVVRNTFREMHQATYYCDPLGYAGAKGAKEIKAQNSKIARQSTALLKHCSWSMKEVQGYLE